MAGGESACGLTAYEGPREEKGNVCQRKEHLSDLEIVRAKLKCPAEGDNTEDIDHREWKAGERPSSRASGTCRLFISILLWSTLSGHFGMQDRTPLEKTDYGQEDREAEPGFLWIKIDTWEPSLGSRWGRGGWHVGCKERCRVTHQRGWKGMQDANIWNANRAPNQTN